MSLHHATADLADIATISANPKQTQVDRNFGLPTGLYVGTVAGYLAFLGIMSSLFMTGELAIPMVIFTLFIVMAFGLCAVWSRMQPDNPTRPLSWGQFSNFGIMTASGPLSAWEATAQVLLLPVLIVFWGVCIGLIVALT